MKVNESFAKDALRVLAFAFKPVTQKENAEKEMIFIGLQAMIDPPRKEARDSLLKCEQAGIRVVMITGDQLFYSRGNCTRDRHCRKSCFRRRA